MNVLSCAKKYGEVIIITNAQQNWVENSSILMPGLQQFLKKINIISARYLYEHKNSDPETWKNNVFLDKTLNIFNKYLQQKQNVVINMICIGDSDYEHNAAKYTLAIINNQTQFKMYIRNIKLVSNPSFDILLIQLHRIIINFDKLTQIITN